jgi:hypothetical protein
MKIVYAYLDPRRPGNWKTTEVTFKHEPFYVGEGKASRRFDHLGDVGSSHKARRIRAIKEDSFTPIIVVIKENLTKVESVTLETSLIRQLGTRAIIKDVTRGPLTNQRLYGKTGNISEETKAKMSRAKKGIKFTAEHRKKLSLARAGRSYSRKPTGPLSDEHKMKISERQRGRVKTALECFNISAAQRGRIITPEHRRKISVACKGRASPNVRPWRIEFDTGDSVITENLRVWCEERGIIPNSLRNTLSSGKFFRGMKLRSLPRHSAIVDINLHLHPEASR